VELARLLIADFDPAVTAIAAQPFLLRAYVGGRVLRHVPDFFLVRADETALLMNVKPAARRPGGGRALEWPGRLARERGWDYEVWSGTDLVSLANVRFLVGYRRPWLLPAGLADAVLAASGQPLPQDQVHGPPAAPSRPGSSRASSEPAQSGSRSRRPHHCPAPGACRRAPRTPRCPSELGRGYPGLQAGRKRRISALPRLSSTKTRWTPALAPLAGG
jgi:hypothetical protein